MTDLLSSTETPSDAELISRVRGGDVTAYGELFSRHVEAARRLARQLTRGSADSEDLVSDAFAKVLQVLQGGGGPDVAFRAYLLTAVRRLHVDRVRAGTRVQTSDDMTEFDPGIPFQDTAVASFESGAAAKAFASLPERWQLVLWHLEVEGNKPADVGPLLGMSANSVSALAYRAREGLRQAFLTMHLADISADQCRWTTEHLGAYVRSGLSKRDTGKVEDHLRECRRCTAMYLELTEVNSNLRGLIAPLVLGAAAAGYLSSGGAAGTGGVLALMGRVRDVVLANTTAATAGAVAAGVAVVGATTGIVIASANHEEAATQGARGAGAAVSSAAPGTSLPEVSTSPHSPTDTPSTSAPAVLRTTGTQPLLQQLDAAAPVVPPGPVGTSTSALPAVTGPEPHVTGADTVPPSQQSATTRPPSAKQTPESGAGAPARTPSSEATSPSTSTSQTTSPSQAPMLVEADLGVAGLTLQDHTAQLTVQGKPDLPPTVVVQLTSQPAGITFDLDGRCTVALLSDPGTAVCHTGVPYTSARLARVAEPDVTDRRTIATGLPLFIPADQGKTRVHMAVSVPDGYTDDAPGNNGGDFVYDPPTRPTEAPTTGAPTSGAPTTGAPTTEPPATGGSESGDPGDSTSDEPGGSTSSPSDPSSSEGTPSDPPSDAGDPTEGESSGGGPEGDDTGTPPTDPPSSEPPVAPSFAVHARWDGEHGHKTRWIQVVLVGAPPNAEFHIQVKGHGNSVTVVQTACDSADEATSTCSADSDGSWQGRVLVDVPDGQLHEVAVTAILVDEPGIRDSAEVSGS